VTLPCRATGVVRLTATSEGPKDVEPAAAAVSLVKPRRTVPGPGSSFCNQSHFLTSADAAKDWLAEHPEGRVLPVTDAYEAGRPLIERDLFGSTTADCLQKPVSRGRRAAR
jgi:alkylmercury lyase